MRANHSNFPFCDKIMPHEKISINFCAIAYQSTMQMRADQRQSTTLRANHLNIGLQQAIVHSQQIWDSPVYQIQGGTRRNPSPLQDNVHASDGVCFVTAIGKKSNDFASNSVASPGFLGLGDGISQIAWLSPRQATGKISFSRCHIRPNIRPQNRIANLPRHSAPFAPWTA